MNSKTERLWRTTNIKMGARCSKINIPAKPVKDVVIMSKIKGKIYCQRDLDSNVLLLDIGLEGWNSTQVRKWPDKKNTRKWNNFGTHFAIISLTESISSS